MRPSCPAARRRLPIQCLTVLGRPRNPSVTRSCQSWAALRHPSFHRLVSISTNGSSVLPPDGCFHERAWPSRSHRRTVLRSVPSSAAMRVMDAPAARNRAVSSYRDWRRACEAMVARSVLVGADGTGVAEHEGVVSANACRCALTCWAARPAAAPCLSARLCTASPRLRSRCHRSATWTASGAPCRTPSA